MVCSLHLGGSVTNRLFGHNDIDHILVLSTKTHVSLRECRHEITET